MHETVTESGHCSRKKTTKNPTCSKLKKKKATDPVINADDRTLDVGSRSFAFFIAASCSSYVKRKSKYLSSAQVEQAGCANSCAGSGAKQTHYVTASLATWRHGPCFFSSIFFFKRPSSILVRLCSRGCRRGSRPVRRFSGALCGGAAQLSQRANPHFVDLTGSSDVRGRRSGFTAPPSPPNPAPPPGSDLDFLSAVAPPELPRDHFQSDVSSRFICESAATL